MNFSYQKYVQRYHYDPYCWPPDLGLAELHARCSQPGLINHLGVQCPCCGRRSKKILDNWWRRNITQDLKQYGAAIPGYFQLMTFYGCFMIGVILLNTIYPIYTSYYTCQYLDPQDNFCLDVGFLQYIQFNDMIRLLKFNNEEKMVQILMILQSIVFYILLFANFFSIFYITLLNESAKQQIRQKRSSKASRFLMFHNIQENNLKSVLNGSDNSKQYYSEIIKAIKIYDIKKYTTCFKKRNQLYYKILSLCVIPKDPILAKSMNQKLQQAHTQLLQQKKKFEEDSGKMVVMFSSTEAKNQVLKKYKVPLLKRWQYGIKTILRELNISNQNFQTDLCAITLVEGSDLKWENLGAGIGLRSASRFKTFIVASIFITLCYIILYYPLLFSMKVTVKQQQTIFTNLNTFQKILPNITSIVIVALSVYFRKYMQKLAEQRNPKDQLQKSSFVLLTTLTFHIIFFVFLPTLFFMVPNRISSTIKLYVISGQARTFIIIQVILVLVDMPYKIWKNKKVKNLSDQRYAFRYNQKMLHQTVQSRDYPLQGRVLVLFRVWSLAIFYSFFSGYVLLYVVIAFSIIFWIQKRNLYNHYSVRRKISIKLFSQVLIYFVNFFSIFLCFIYCYNVQQNSIKITIAVFITLISIIGNIIYWIFLNKSEDESLRLSRSSSNSSQTYSIQSNSSKSSDISNSLLLKQQTQQNEVSIWNSAQHFQNKYHQFLKSIKNDTLDNQVTQYLTRFSDREENPLRKSVQIQMVGNNSEQNENNVKIQEQDLNLGFDSD